MLRYFIGWCVFGCSKIKDLDFDRAGFDVGRGLEGFDGFFKWEAVGDQRLEVNQTVCHQPDSLRVLVCVTKSALRKQVRMSLPFPVERLHEILTGTGNQSHWHSCE